MFTGDSVNMFTSDLANMFIKNLVKISYMFTRGKVDLSTSELEKSKKYNLARKFLIETEW